MTTHPNEKRGSTQCDRLLAHLENEGTINPLEAWQKLGIYRLSARVYDLRARGINIKERPVEVKNRWGETARVGEYYIEQPKPAAPIRTDQQQAMFA